MTGDERRETILGALRRAEGPLSGARLAGAVGVSRQVVVQDIALLRANGHDVIATARGYVLREGANPQLPTRVVKVHHTQEETADELNAVVDLGGTVLNVMVNHRVYGKIVADLDIRSRRDAARYLADIQSGKSVPLMTVTSGYHFHRIVAETEQQLDEIEAALSDLGFLAQVMPYEREL